MSRTRKDILARAMRKAARAIMRAIRKVLALVFGGTFADIGRDVDTVRGIAGGVAGRAALGAAHTVDGVGRTLGLGYRMTHGIASGVGGLLGALVPRPPVGPADVAAAAAAQDRRETQANDNLRDTVAAAISAAPAPSARARLSPPPLSPVETVALVREAAALMQKKDPGAAAVIDRLPHQAGNWLLLLEDADLARLTSLPSGAVWRHVAGVQPVAGLRPIASVSSGAIPTQEELDEIVRRSMRDMKQSAHEIAEMAKRPGSAPRPRLPTEPAYGAEAEAIFSASPRAVAY
ncbi:hypothetical protein LPC10_17495 [Methylorubrum sp. B1-46]|uniref:hypothetical protein n=1 Tax=Methylorubrum TaxID=2282523 RepID=UPI001E35F8C8|nr:MULTISPECIES: hypothetical protein [Methylorubrum]MCG5246913.1 hypothetical protein [Methylorubrum extorquens]UGB24728.1 hypothetical protein LPC10_17495 [Methylorubrum sp. B1-46]